MKDRAKLGRALTILGAIGIVLTLVAGVIAFVLVGRLHHSIDQSLEVAVEAIDSVDGTITISKDVVDAVGGALDAVADTVSTVESSSDAVAGTLDTLHTFVTSNLPTAIDGVEGVLPTIKTVAGTIDSALKGLSRIPLAPDYSPEVPFADSIQQLTDALAPLSTDLESLGTNIADLKTTVDGLNTDFTTITTAIDGIRDQVTAAQTQLDLYQSVTQNAKQVATDAQHDLHSDIIWTRLLVVVLALALLATQALTVLVGRLVTETSGEDQEAANASSPAASAEPPPDDGSTKSLG